MTRLFAHLQATDPERFVVATVPQEHRRPTTRPRATGSSPSARRSCASGCGSSRCCSSCPSSRARARADLLARLLPADDGDGPGDRDRQRPADLERAVRDARDRPAHAAAEPVGLPREPEAFGELPSGVVPLPFDELAAGPPDGVGSPDARRGDRRPRSRAARRRPPGRPPLPAQRIAARLAVPRPGRHAVGYGYAGEAGRVGPVAVRDEALLGPVLGHLTSAVAAARRVRALGRRRRGSGGRAGAPGGLPARPVPGPPLLGPAVRRLLALPADLAGAPLAGRPTAGRWSGAAMHRPSRLPEHPPSGSLGPTWLPSAVPADGVVRSRRRSAHVAVSHARGADM